MNEPLFGGGGRERETEKKVYPKRFELFCFFPFFFLRPLFSALPHVRSLAALFDTHPVPVAHCKPAGGIGGTDPIRLCPWSWSLRESRCSRVMRALSLLCPLTRTCPLLVRPSHGCVVCGCCCVARGVACGGGMLTNVDTCGCGRVPARGRVQRKGERSSRPLLPYRGKEEEM